MYYNPSTILPTPSKEFIKRVEKELFGFVWRKKPDKIKRKIMYNTYEHGGLKMTDYESFCNALKISWIKRLNDENNEYNMFKVDINISMFSVLMVMGITYLILIL